MDGEWIIPFAGRYKSGWWNQNFLWRNEVVYIMDNHRAALWCWLQHLEQGTKYDLIHVDRHSDALHSRIGSWIEKLADLDKLTIQKYLERRYRIDAVVESPVICCGNYLSIFLRLYPDSVDRLLFATAGEGDEPQWQRIIKVDPLKLSAYLESELSGGSNIVNIDLDYFFDRYKPQVLIFSDEFVRKMFKIIRKGISKKTVTVLTIALSPEWCGGWKRAEALLSVICETLELNLALKKTKALKAHV
jgi:hypothetical protein